MPSKMEVASQHWTDWTDWTDWTLQSDATSFASGRQLGLDILWALVPEFKSNVVVPLTHTLEYSSYFIKSSMPGQNACNLERWSY